MPKSPIWLAVDKINKRLDKIEASFNTPVVAVEVPLEVPLEVPVKVPGYPIPAEYKEIVELTFNKSFGVRLEPMSDSPSFLFSIVVPKKYSRVTAGEDLRPKVITYSDGVSGVRLWADKVFGNFDGDTQALIVQDRPFVQAQI